MGLFDFLNFGSQVAGQILNQSNQERAWRREDTAIQRRVADLKAAGLSPVLAAGAGASSMAPVRIEAPQYRPDVENMSANIARTNADRALVNQRLAIGELQAVEARNRLNYLRLGDKDAGLDIANPGWALAQSQVRREIAENHEAVRNIGIYQGFGVPSIGSAGDSAISGSLLLKNLFPDMDPGKAGGMGVLMQLLQSILGSGLDAKRVLSPMKAR